MPATRKYLIKISQRKDYKPHRSTFVNKQRALILSGTYDFIPPQKRARYHITPKERKEHSVKCRPAYTYRGARRVRDKFVKKVEKNRNKRQAQAAILRALADVHMETQS